MPLGYAASETRQSARLLAGGEEQGFFDNFRAIVGQFQPAVLVYLEGEIIKSVLTSQDVLIQQDARPEKVRPFEFRERRVGFNVAVVLANNPRQAPVGIEVQILDMGR